MFGHIRKQECGSTRSFQPRGAALWDRVHAPDEALGRQGEVLCVVVANSGINLSDVQAALDEQAGLDPVVRTVAVQRSLLALEPGPRTSGCLMANANICGGKSRPVRSK